MITVSIIIATYNRCNDLKLCLDDIFDQKLDVGHIFDVIVVDNNSSDSTKAIVSTFEEKFPSKVRYILEPVQGKCNAINTGIKAAKGDILAFTDDDVRIDPQWLAQMLDCFQTQHCDGVGGRILPVYPTETPAWVKDNISQLAGCIVIYDYGTQTRIYQKPAYEFLGANFAFKRQIFDDCGLFRTDIGPGKGSSGEDTEFVNRVLMSGKLLFYCGKALIRHPVDIQRMTLNYIFQWNIALGRYRVIVDEKRVIDPSLAYWFGVPRYLIREMASDSIHALINLFNRSKFLTSWISLARNCGKAMEIRSIYKKKC